MTPSLRTACAAALIGLGTASAHADLASFTGTLGEPNAVQLFQFSLSAASDVTLRTYGYAGGTNALGQQVAAGGFDPILSLFAGSGAGAVLIDANDDGLGVDTDPTTGEAHDAWLAIHLAAGVYTLALSDFGNFANGPLLSDGFLGGASFDGRSSAWAVDVLGAEAARTVPEPLSPALALTGLAALGAGRRRRR